MAEPKITEYDPKVQEVLSRLRFLAKIDKYEKIDVSSLSLVPDNWYNNVYRWVEKMTAKVALSQGYCWCTPETRTRSLDFIDTTSTEALGLAKELLSSDKALHYSLGQMIVTALSELNPGIESLKKTYAADRMFVSQVESFEKVLAARILDLKLPESSPIKTLETPTTNTRLTKPPSDTSPETQLTKPPSDGSLPTSSPEEASEEYNFPNDLDSVPRVGDIED